MYGIVSYVDDYSLISSAIAMAKSVRPFSKAKLILISPLKDDILNMLFDEVYEDWDMWFMLTLESYEKIFYIPCTMIAIGNIDPVFTHDTPSITQARESPILLKPLRMTYDLLQLNKNMSIRSFYEKYGYTWTLLDGSYSVRAEQYAGEGILISFNDIWDGNEGNTRASRLRYQAYLYTPMRRTIQYVISMLKPILGSSTSITVEKYAYLFDQVFATKKANPILNLELLEAYGDRFLNGEYVWILANTPGMILGEQATVIASYFQDQDRLAELCDRLGLTKYILLGESESLTVKTKSDIIEALVAAIGISWSRMNDSMMEGNKAIRLFTEYVFTTYFTIDTQHYYELYVNPREKVQKLLESLYLDRKLLKRSEPIVENGQVVVNILYGDRIIGTGRISETVERSEKRATDMAYNDVLKKGSIQKLL